MQSAISVTLLSFRLTKEEGLHTADNFRPLDDAVFRVTEMPPYH